MDRLLGCPPEIAVLAAPQAPSLERVYREHFAPTWRILRRLGVPIAQLDDAAQDVFLVVHRRLDKFDPRSPLRSWIFAIAVRVASEYRRRAARRRTEALDEALADRSASPMERQELQDSVRLLDELLGSLDEKRRVVFVLSELEQLTAPEIADVLGENLNTVYSRLRKARQGFEAALARHRAAHPKETR
jgi:RNA polymerase sigma-70 factor (ECF subfamily)